MSISQSSLRCKLRFEDAINESGNAKVVKASVGSSSQLVAVKEVYLKDRSWEVQSRAHLERDILKSLSGHPNVVRLYEAYETEEALFFVLDYYEKDLLTHLSSFEGGMPEREARGLFKQMLRVLKYLHQKKIVHGDLKLDNFLFDDSQQRIVLIDFGSASRLSKKDSTLRILSGTASYVAPEVVVDQEYDGYLSDIYSLGVILFCLATNRLPFEDEDSVYYYSWVENYLDSLHCPTTRMLPPVPLSPELLQLLEKMLCLNPKFRIPLKKIKKDPWVKCARKDPTKGLLKKKMCRASIRVDAYPKKWTFGLF